VRHELDLFVSVTLTTGYEATFIFECKNWQSKVGKNDLIVFSEKIAAVGAQHGFFVARAFTKDARAQAAKDLRVKLLIASHVEPVVRMQFPQMIHTAIGKTDIHVEFGLQQHLAIAPDLETHKLMIGGEAVPANDYVRKWADTVRHEQVRKLDVQAMPDGDYTVRVEGSRAFTEGEATLDDVPLKLLSLSGTAEVAVRRAVVLSIFEVATRGRLVKIGVDHGGLELRADIIELA
jgi:hypothetical protein